MENQELVLLAHQIAVKAHEGQFRKDGTTPYIVHPETVAAQFTEPHLKALALLHDVIENSEYTLAELKKLNIPQGILDSLNRLTRRSLEKYVDYIIVCAWDSDARAVKIEDIKHNLSTVQGTAKDKYELALYILNIINSNK